MEWNPDPDPALIKGLYNGLYAKHRKDGPQATQEAPAKRYKPKMVKAAAKTSKRAYNKAITFAENPLGNPLTPWLADSLLANKRDFHLIPATTRLALIHELSRSPA
jgi:hypothetical protein